jgi:hypothetical protein
MDCPVAYIVFNRPRHTEQTFAAIKAQKPSKLFIIADGPRPGHRTDHDRCHQVRQIVQEIDWSCQVHRNYVETNLGSKRRVSSGLDWVFSHVDRAIILEDDCLASSEFFRFCEVLLNFYKHNEKVWVVSGNSYQPQERWGDGSYYFSRRPDTWGWATWRRAWKHYCDDLPFLEQWIKSPAWRECFPNRNSSRYHKNLFRRTKAGAFDAWDHPWAATIMYHGGLCATPNANLVINIGFDSQATNTRFPSQGQRYELTQLGSLSHPTELRVMKEADELVDHGFGWDRSWLQRTVMKILRYSWHKLFVNRCAATLQARSHDRTLKVCGQQKFRELEP